MRGFQKDERILARVLERQNKSTLPELKQSILFSANATDTETVYLVLEY